MTEEQVAEAGRAAYRDAQHPPMPDELVAKVGALLAPGVKQEAVVARKTPVNAAREEAA